MLALWIGCIFFCIAWHFYHQRKMAEAARNYIVGYCENNDLQFISLAKIRSRIVKDNQRGLLWCNTYQFEFSGDGQSSYEGSLVLRGNKIRDIDMPAYRVS